MYKLQQFNRFQNLYQVVQEIMMYLSNVRVRARCHSYDVSSKYRCVKPNTLHQHEHQLYYIYTLGRSSCKSSSSSNRVRWSESIRD